MNIWAFFPKVIPNSYSPWPNWGFGKVGQFKPVFNNLNLCKQLQHDCHVSCAKHHECLKNYGLKRCLHFPHMKDVFHQKKKWYHTKLSPMISTLLRFYLTLSDSFLELVKERPSFFINTAWNRSCLMVLQSVQHTLRPFKDKVLKHTFTQTPFKEWEEFLQCHQNDNGQHPSIGAQTSDNGAENKAAN